MKGNGPLTNQTFQSLTLPERASKDTTLGLRNRGITMVIDSGMAYGQFADMVESHSDLIDVIKFGWGTSYINFELAEKKAALLQSKSIAYYVGGTLFERYIVENKFDDYVTYCQALHAHHVEVSDGTIIMELPDKLSYITQLASAGFTVFSEVGQKPQDRQNELSDADDWVKLVQAEQDAGARYSILEARESGSAGIATSEGKLRQDIIDAFVAAKVPIDSLIFEAPTRALQRPLLEQFGANVNLGNIAPSDIIPLETLRVGLRSDTFLLGGEAINVNPKFKVIA